MKYIATVIAVLLSIGASSAMACPGEKMTDEGKTSTPIQTPKT